MKKLCSILWGISIVVLTSISITSAYTQEQYQAYQWAYKYGITTQPTAEAANLDGNLTRQAFAKMIVNYLENAVGVNKNIFNSCSFPDEHKITNDLKSYAGKTCAYNIMWSDGKNFNPTHPVDRAQLGTVLSRVLWWDEYNTNGQWYYVHHLDALKQNWIMNKIDNPQSNAKRWDVLIMLKRTYDKFGSNIYLNGWSANSYDTTSNLEGRFSIELDEDTNIIYVWKDGTRYAYDKNLIKLLKNTAEKKWESDLAKYLEIEAKFIENWLDPAANFSEEEFLKQLWIDIDDLDGDKITQKERQQIVKIFKEWLKQMLNENESNNSKYLKDLKNIVDKAGSSDKFWLKEKYEETKTFIEASNSFMETYAEILSEMAAISYSASDEDIENNEEVMMNAFSLLWASFMYESATQTYQEYIEAWAKNAIKLLWGELIK